MPDKTPEHMSDKVSECIADRLSEYSQCQKCQIKCQNICQLAGITRCKVVCNKQNGLESILAGSVQKRFTKLDSRLMKQEQLFGTNSLA